MENNKRKNVYIVIFIITTIVASCAAIYFGIMGNKNVEELQAKVEELTTESDTTEVKQEEVVEETENEKNAIVTEKVVEKVVEKGIIPKYDPTKMKNKPDNISYSSNIMYGQAVDGLNAKINAEGNVQLTVYRDGEGKEVKINGLNGKVIDVCQGTLGDGSNDAVLFLTENGDVYFADNISTATNKYQGNWTLNAEKITSVSNICRVLWTMSNRTTNNTARARATFIGIDTNGNCYDLWYECKGTK